MKLSMKGDAYIQINQALSAQITTKDFHKIHIVSVIAHVTTHYPIVQHLKHFQT